MEQVVAKVVIPGQIEILALSDHLNIKPELIYKLNAGYTKWASPPSYESIFYLPIEKAELFNSNNNEFKKQTILTGLLMRLLMVTIYGLLQENMTLRFQSLSK